MRTQARDLRVLHAHGHLLDVPHQGDEAAVTRGALEREAGGLHRRSVFLMGIEHDLSVSDLLSYRYPEEVGMKRTASPLARSHDHIFSLLALPIYYHPPAHVALSLASFTALQRHLFLPLVRTLLIPIYTVLTTSDMYSCC